MNIQEYQKLENTIRKELDLPISDDLQIYNSLPNKEYYTKKINEIVNNYIPKIEPSYDPSLLETIERDGYVVVENFVSQEEVDKIINFTKEIKGYQFHIPNRAFNTTPEFYNENLNWNVCSYKMNHVLTNPTILKLLTRRDIVSLAQDYIGCLPVIGSTGLWWSKYTGEEFHTQKIHRDLDDFKFLAFFIYLSDVDDENGPHVYYKNTHKGSHKMDEKVVVKGKAGTAIFGDTYALHKGQPLNSGDRLLFMTRYTLHKNNNFYRNLDSKLMLPHNMFFDIVEENEVNKRLLSSYILSES